MEKRKLKVQIERHWKDGTIHHALFEDAVHGKDFWDWVMLFQGVGFDVESLLCCWLEQARDKDLFSHKASRRWDALIDEMRLCIDEAGD